MVVAVTYGATVLIKQRLKKLGIGFISLLREDSAHSPAGTLDNPNVRVVFCRSRTLLQVAACKQRISYVMVLEAGPVSPFSASYRPTFVPRISRLIAVSKPKAVLCAFFRAANQHEASIRRDVCDGFRIRQISKYDILPDLAETSFRAITTVRNHDKFQETLDLLVHVS